MQPYNTRGLHQNHTTRYQSICTQKRSSSVTIRASCTIIPKRKQSSGNHRTLRKGKAKHTREVKKKRGKRNKRNEKENLETSKHQEVWCGQRQIGKGEENTS
jgi:hypothetical protein